MRNRSLMINERENSLFFLFYLKEINTFVCNYSNTKSTIRIDHFAFWPNRNIFDWWVKNRSVHVSDHLKKKSIGFHFISFLFTVFDKISPFSNWIECSSHRRRKREKRIFSMKFFACGTRQIWIEPWRINLYRWRLINAARTFGVNGESNWIVSFSRFAINDDENLKANGTTIELWTKSFLRLNLDQRAF